MDMQSLATLGRKHVSRYALEKMFIWSGHDLTRPTTFFGMINERCNIKCRYCDYWRMAKYRDEMSIAEWQAALTSVRDFVGRFQINFSGGEPLIKPGAIDLLAWCGENRIFAGITTNGSTLTERNAEKLVLAKPFNINISVDSTDSETNDYVRGRKGLFDKVDAGIRMLREEQARHDIRFPIIIKPTITSQNLHALPDIVDWAEEIGATCVNFQPLERWTSETYDELWLETDRIAELQAMVDRLIAMKRSGRRIFNSVQNLACYIPHFREQKEELASAVNPIVLRNFTIRPDGEVEIGFFDGSCGNIKRQSAQEIWQGTIAQTVRREKLTEPRVLLNSAGSERSLLDKFRMGLMLLRG